MAGAVRELLSDETKWCKGAKALRREACPVDPDSVFACRWCLIGAVEKVSWWPHTEVLWDRIRAAGARLFPQFQDQTGIFRITKFNDHPDTTFEDVARVLDEAGV